MRKQLHTLVCMAMLIAIIIFAPISQSCGKIELPDSEEKDEKTAGEEEKEEAGENEETADTLLPSQVAKLTAERYVTVKGYIVGYINGLSPASTVLGIPADAQNTNMLIADSPDATKDDALLPVELKAKGSLPTRLDLNLYDHPENYKRLVIIKGLAQAYFGIIGVKDITSYEFPANGGGISSPAVDHDPQIVEGR